MKFSMVRDDIVNQDDSTNVVLFGIETHVCILQSALEAASIGKKVWVISDAVTTRYPTDHEIALKRLQATENICLSTTESIMFELIRTADHPDFRKFSEMIIKRDLV